MNVRNCAIAAAFSTALMLHGCSSGSGGSEVGDKGNAQPVARPLIVNSGTTNRVREGSEVLLTGRDSEDFDGPILKWEWSLPSNAPTDLVLVTRSSTTVSFTAPDVNSDTTYRFSLTVTDADGATDTETIDVTVVPAGDPNRFLSPLVLRANPTDEFTVVAALGPGVSVGPVDAPFTLTLQATVSYMSRAGVAETLNLDVPAFRAAIAGVWPAGQTVSCAAGQTAFQCMLGSYVNPQFDFQVPRLDVAELNQRFLDSGEVDRQLDPHMTDTAVIEIALSLDGASLQDVAELLVTAGGVPVAQSGTAALGTLASLSIEADDLLNTGSGEETRRSAEAYYRTVDPLERRQTLNDWLFLAGFAQDANGTLLPDAVSGNGEFAHAKYTNNFDLGFGRDMYSRVAPNGDVFAWVVNYPTLEAATKNTDSFVTVVMEFTPPEDPSLDMTCAAKGRFVKFFTYAPDQTGDSQLVTSMNFDGRGERYTPGNCIACHGGSTGDLDQLVPHPTTGEDIFRECGDTNASFMPWDLDSFLYTDTDPAILNGARRPDGRSFLDHIDPARRFTRGAQEEQFRKLNEAALSTYQTYVAEGGNPDRINAAINLVQGWYGGAADVPGTAFNGMYTPPGWDTSAEIEDVYHSAYARYCRACHTQLANSELQFQTYDDFIVDQNMVTRDIEGVVYREGTMPLARLSMDRFWAPFDGGASAAAVLAARLAADVRVGMDPTLRPGEPELSISRIPDPAKERDLVRLDSAGSLFTATPTWASLASTANGACIAADLLGADANGVVTNRAAAFEASLPGRYCIELASGGASTIAEFDVNANQLPFLIPTNPPFEVNENAGPTAIELTYGDADDNVNELVYTLVGTPLNGTLSLSGAPLGNSSTFRQDQIDQGQVQYDPDQGLTGNLAAGVRVAGGFDFTLTDGIGTLTNLQHRFDIVGVNDGQPSLSVSPITSTEVYFGGSVAFGSNKISASDPDSANSALTIGAAVGGAAPAGSITAPPGASIAYDQVLSGSTFTYTHDGRLPTALNRVPIDLTDQITISVSDGANAAQAAINVTARVSFANNVAPVILSTCAGCHNSGMSLGAANFLLPGDAAVSYTTIRNRVVATPATQENACGVNTQAPTSLLLRKPTTVDAHTGGLQSGFALNQNIEDRNSYELFRLWICNGALND